MGCIQNENPHIGEWWEKFEKSAKNRERFEICEKVQTFARKLQKMRDPPDSPSAPPSAPLCAPPRSPSSPAIAPSAHRRFLASPACAARREARGNGEGNEGEKARVTRRTSKLTGAYKKGLL